MENNELEIEISALSAGGNGIGRHEGKVTFVPDSCPGDKLLVEISKSNKKFDEAKIVEIITPSENRVEPPCEYFATCGGCQWQHIDYKLQLDEKLNILKQNLSRVGKIEDADITVYQSPTPLKTRIKVKLHLDKKGNLGFMERNSHDIVPFDSCLAMHPALDELVSKLKPAIKEHYLKNAEIELGFSPVEKMGAASFRFKDRVKKGLARILVESVEGLAGVIVKAKIVRDSYGETAIRVAPASSCGDSRHKINSFWQSHYELNQTALEIIAKELDDETRPDTSLALELFAGSGNITRLLAKRFASVIAVESDKKACELLGKNIKNCDASVEILNTEAAQSVGVLKKKRIKPDVILLDPPRTGFASGIEKLAGLNSPVIIYMSCNSATFARDAGLLAAKGYSLKSIAMLDFFPQTHHFETLAVFKL